MRTMAGPGHQFGFAVARRGRSFRRAACLHGQAGPPRTRADGGRGAFLSWRSRTAAVLCDQPVKRKSPAACLRRTMAAEPGVSASHAGSRLADVSVGAHADLV